MPNATLCPAQIIIPKIGAVIITNPEFFSQTNNMSNVIQKWGKKQL
jgi:hypothetical protein